MLKTLFTHLFIWCAVLGFTLTAVAQDNSVGKVPMTTEKPTVNYGITNEAPFGAGTAYGQAGISENFISMLIPAGDPFTIIGSMVSPGFLASGTFGPTGILYFTDSSTNELFTVDVASGVLTFVGSTDTVILRGITYDWATDTFWGCSGSDLYTVDVSTGNTTLVGAFGIAGFMIDLAVDCDGNMYGYNVQNPSNFYSINTATGAATLIGNLGYDALFGQGMSYDYATGVLYLSAFNNTSFTGQLRTVDVATGMTTLVFDWGFEQVAPFAIDQNCGATSAEEDDFSEIPLQFGLFDNYPNPFNPTTLIKYSIPENGFVKLSVYNLVGEEVSVIVNEMIDAGFYEVTFNAAGLPIGIYFYRIQAGSFVETKKMVLLR